MLNDLDREAKREVDRVCDMCGNALKDKVWTLRGLIYKCCSAECLLYIHANPHVSTWEDYLEENDYVERGKS